MAAEEKQDAARKASEKEDAERGFGHVPWGSGRGFQYEAQRNKQPARIVRSPLPVMLKPLS